MNEPELMVVGNLTHDPELRYTQNGVAFATFTVAQTPRVRNAQTNQWEDGGETLFMRCSVWREVAENVHATLTKGMRVFASGRLVQKTWTTRENEKRTGVELQVEEVGPTLKSATAVVTRVAPGGGTRDGGEAWGARPTMLQQQQPPQPQADQWAAPAAPAAAGAPASTGTVWDTPDTGWGDEVPF